LDEQTVQEDGYGNGDCNASDCGDGFGQEQNQDIEIEDFPLEFFALDIFDGDGYGDPLARDSSIF
jgi:hypothetical protein